MVRDPTGDAYDTGTHTGTHAGTGPPRGRGAAAPADVPGSASDADAKDAPEDAAGTPIGRRIVLGMLGLGAAGIVFGDAAGHLVPPTRAPCPAVDVLVISDDYRGYEPIAVVFTTYYE